MSRPCIGITMDNDPDTQAPARWRVAHAYFAAVMEAGGMPVALPQAMELAEEYVAMCDGVILTGGDDPVMEAFGEKTHPEARRIDPQRQAFELALLEALDARAATPVLGICLGMQLMALHHGGALDQYLPETLGEDGAAAHMDGRSHAVSIEVNDSILGELTAQQPEAHGLQSRGFAVHSHHRQAVREPGALRTIARAPDGVIEAIDAPDSARPFYLGVQWHPERNPTPGSSNSNSNSNSNSDKVGPLNRGLIQYFVRAARATTSGR